MPTNRTPIERERRPSFDGQTLALFIELEGTSRNSRAFKDGEHELARRLGLVSEYWTCNSVLDRSTMPHQSKAYLAYGDWHRCRQARRELLAACGIVREFKTSAQATSAGRLKEKGPGIDTGAES